MSEQDLRKAYLKSWEPYPVVSDKANAPAGEKVFRGRILQLIEGQLLLQVGQKKQSFSRGLTSWNVLKTESESWQDSGHNGAKLQVFREGDWVQVTVAVEDLELKSIWLLAPNLRADFPIAKTSGLATSFTAFTDQVRQHFLSLDFDEASTPTLVNCPGLEPHLKPFSTRWSMATEQPEFYLPTSPELHLKKLLCRGYDRIFEVKKVFRDDFKSPNHRPEFHMLEWYMAFASLSDLEAILEKLVRSLSDDQLSWQRTSVRELFQELYGFELSACYSREQLIPLCERHGLDILVDDSFDDLFQKAWVQKIEPALETMGGAVIVYDFPPSQAALSRLTEAGWADRFELYLHGKEVANAYQELNDSLEQRTRFEEFVTQRQDQVPIDESFMDHLSSGMPPSAGIAVGLERLYMALFKVETIDQIFEFDI